MLAKKLINPQKEKEFERLHERTKELEDSRRALLNILDDAESTRAQAIEERDKTLAIITNLVDGLLLFDKEEKLSLINPKARNLFNISPKEAEKIQGKPFLELNKLPQLQPLIKFLGENIKKITKEELPLTENLILEVSAVFIISKKEKLGTLVILHDITKDKLIERMKTEFVSIAAHQLRTPLSAIKWSLNMLLDKKVKETPETQKELLEKTYESNERMINLINDLLNVTRIEEGRFLYNIDKHDLVKIIKKTVRTAKEMTQRKSINFRLKIPQEKIPKLNMDAEKMSLAIQNLVENAVHYTGQGGKITVSVKHDKEKKEIIFMVEDTGIGIPRDQEKRVFGTFFRAANAIKSETQGTGLGLFITKNIIEAHKGNIWFKSQENKGSTFCFTLPLNPK